MIVWHGFFFKHISHLFGTPERRSPRAGSAAALAETSNATTASTPPPLRGPLHLALAGAAAGQGEEARRRAGEGEGRRRACERVGLQVGRLCKVSITPISTTPKSKSILHLFEFFLYSSKHH
jgi:hypothetical protein